MNGVSSAEQFPFSQRIWVLVGGAIILYGILGYRLITLQVFRTDYYTSLAETQRKRASELAPHRGVIYVAENKGEELFPIAVNTEQWIVYASPRDVKDPEYTARELAPQLLAFRKRQQERINDILRMTGQQPRDLENQPSDEEQQETLRQELVAKLDRKRDPYEPLIRPYEVIDEPLHTFLSDKTLPGIMLEETSIRYYPENTLASHVLGYLGWENEQQVGRYGIEGYFEDSLKGKLGFLAGEKDAHGNYIGVSDRTFQAAQDGDNIVLTLDRVVQTIIEEELKKGIEKYGAERGSVIVMNPKTGAVLGMATYPTFNPNYYFAVDGASVQRNPVISEIFEPGSILKPVVMAAAMNKGLVTPDTTTIDNGPVKVADRVINTYDGKHHGRQTMTQLLEQSNNVGMVWVGQLLGAEAFYDYLRRFGLGERTGIEMEGETQTILPEPNDWNVTTVATTSFGQGIAMTPLQALNAINVIANGGKLMQPYIVSKIQKSSGEALPTEPHVVRQVIDKAIADQVAAMMVSVIENGVATAARVPGYYLAGKTGTAQVPDERGKYSPDKKIISFVGFGPMEDPQFSILIKLDNPAGLSFASGTSAPMFSAISKKLLNYYQISPDYDPATRQKPFKVSP